MKICWPPHVSPKKVQHENPQFQGPSIGTKKIFETVGSSSAEKTGNHSKSANPQNDTTANRKQTKTKSAAESNTFLTQHQQEYMRVSIAH